MKTSVELDDEKVRLARKLSDAATLKELLDQALADDAIHYLHNQQAAQIRCSLLQMDLFQQLIVNP